MPGTSRGVAHDVDREALLRPLLGEVEAGAVVEVHAQRRSGPCRGAAARAAGLAPLQPAGPGQVHDQVQPVDVEVEELAAPHARR